MATPTKSAPATWRPAGRAERRRRSGGAVSAWPVAADQLDLGGAATTAEGEAATAATPATLADRLRAEARAAGGITTSPTAPVVGGGPTLDELLVGAWEGLSAHRTVSCPVCSGAMVPRSTTGPESGAGHCGDCGSSLR